MLDHEIFHLKFQFMATKYDDELVDRFVLLQLQFSGQLSAYTYLEEVLNHSKLLSFRFGEAGDDSDVGHVFGINCRSVWQ
jgi:hypothetical protein